jgi:hypothetical protein
MSNSNLKENIQKLLDLETKEDEYKSILSQIKEEKDLLSLNIMNFMESNNIKDKDIILGNKKIKYTSSKVQENISKKYLIDKLTQYFKDQETANKLTNFIYDSRTSTQKNHLHISDIKNV